MAKLCFLFQDLITVDATNLVVGCSYKLLCSQNFLQVYVN